MFFFFVGERRLELKLQTARSFPLWSYGAYLETLDLSYRKVAIIDRVGQLLASTHSDKDLAVAKSTIEAFPTSEAQYEDFSEYRHLTLKSQDPSEFWDEITTRKRPAVFYKSEGKFTPILGLRDEELQLLSAKVSSPGEFSILGAASLCAQLFFNYAEHRRREESAERARDLDNIRISRELVQLESEIVRHEEALRNRGIPPGVRQYQAKALEEVRRMHARSANRLNIKITGIDRRV